MATPRPSACGVDCAACGQYKVTMEQDVASAESMVPWFRSMGWIGENDGAEAILQKAPLCKGCWDVAEDCFWKCGCGKRDFRICCTEKGIQHCGECNEFPCDNYTTWVSWHEVHEQAMAHLMALRESKD